MQGDAPVFETHIVDDIIPDESMDDDDAMQKDDISNIVIDEFSRVLDSNKILNNIAHGEFAVRHNRDRGRLRGKKRQCVIHSDCDPSEPKFLSSRILIRF